MDFKDDVLRVANETLNRFDEIQNSNVRCIEETQDGLIALSYLYEMKDKVSEIVDYLSEQIETIQNAIDNV